MVGDLTIASTATFKGAKGDRPRSLSDRLTNGSCPSPGDAIELTRTESVENAALTVTDASATAAVKTEETVVTRERQDDGRANEQGIYGDTFASSCAELASYGDAVCNGRQPGTTWLAQIRRRCSNVRNWLPKMCACLEGKSAFIGRSGMRLGSYEPLGSKSSLFEFNRTMENARRLDVCTNECEDDKQIEELRFYNDDHTWYNLTVEKNLRTIDLCQLLKVKRNVTGIAWSILETWPELGIERTLEDHEDILAVHKEMKMFASRHERKFVFRADFLKYEFFLNPTQFFPSDMVAFPCCAGEYGGSLIDAESALRSYLLGDDVEYPQVFNLVWIRNGQYDVWRRTYMLLRDRKIYITRKMNASSSMQLPDNNQLTPVAHLSDYVVYKITNAKKFFNAPFDWGICLRPSSRAEAESTVTGELGLKVIAFHSEKSRVCWLTAMRLAKYGKQLRENYRAFRNKQCKQSSGGSPKERYANYNVSNESNRSRVAMDFTGSVGRIVEDPKEAKDIAESEGINWRRTWRPFCRPSPGCAMVRLHGLDDGIHVLQPWFHRGLKRDIAAAIVRDHGSVDGVFLVRESNSNLGAYVLTYKYSDKVFHAQIQPVYDERCNSWLYTLDKGITKFYDLLQLIEFYQLNAGCLPTRLTHYVQNGIAAPILRPEDGGASPSPPDPVHRFASAVSRTASI